MKNVDPLEKSTCDRPKSEVLVRPLRPVTPARYLEQLAFNRIATSRALRRERLIAAGEPVARDPLAYPTAPLRPARASRLVYDAVEPGLDPQQLRAALRSQRSQAKALRTGSVERNKSPTQERQHE